MQSVLPLQFLGNGHAAFVASAVFDFPAVRPDLDRYDMDVPAVCVGMFKNNVRLLAISHSFHIFVGDVCQLFIVEQVFRVGI